jgi:hypothetical protein
MDLTACYWGSTNGPNSTVRALALYPSDPSQEATDLYVGGDFTTLIQDGVSFTGTNRLLKIRANFVAGGVSGVISSGFDVTSGRGANGSIRAIAVSGEDVFIGGSFTAYDVDASLQTTRYFAKLNVDTVPTQTFASPNGPNSHVYALAADATHVYLGGLFSTFNGTNAYRVAKVAISNGALNTTFIPTSGANGASGTINALLLDAANSVLYIGGSFSSYRSVVVNNIVKVSTSTGAYDSTFSPATGGNGFTGSPAIPYALSASGSNLFIGGSLTFYRGRANVNNVKVNKTSGIQVP